MNKNKRNIIIFSVVAITCGWLGVWVDNFIESPSEEETLGMGIWLVFPLLTVILFRLFTKEGWKDLGFKLTIKGNLKWYFTALLIYPLVTTIVLLLGKVFGWIDFTNFKTAIYWEGFVVALLPNFIKNIFEESVWRGYLTTKLLQEKVKDGWLYLLVGGVWGIWHLPYYLHFLPESDMYQILPVGRLIFAFVAILTMIAWTVMFVEIFRLTKSIWSVVLLHMMEDSLVNHLIIDGHITIIPGKELLISPISGGITTLIYVGIGFFLRKKRIERDRELSI